MRPWGVASVLAAAGALALPAPALAVDHVSLFVFPSKLGGAEGWRLSASVPAPEFQGGEILGVTLTRSFLNGRAEEKHALRATMPVPTVSFDGRRGRWNIRNQLGPALSVNLAIRARGAAQPLTQYRECTGAFAQVPVALNGRLVLRTQTAFFGTIRRVRLRGVVIFNRGGPVVCTRTATTTTACMPSTSLSAWTPDSSATLYATSDRTGTLILTFREPIESPSSPGPVWYHLLTVTGFAPLVGALPTLQVGVPPSFPLTGNGTFTGGESGETTAGPCRLTRMRGAFTGSFRTRFAGWGVRTLTLSGGEASYSEAR
jgi:hypothetical protein